MKQSKIYIYGKHAVSEALTHKPGEVRKVLLSPKMDDKKLLELIHHSGVAVDKLDERKISSQVEGNAPHQGVVALISLSGLVIPFETFVTSLTLTADTLLVLLSEVQDPHNVGAIIRSAAAFGASAVMMPVYKQSPISGMVIKASAGTAFAVPLVTLGNMQQALATLKKKGVKVYGLAGEGYEPLEDEEFASPSILVFGNEAQGLAPAAKVLCDKMLKIAINPRAESLNVAGAAAVAMYQWSTKHPRALA